MPNSSSNGNNNNLLEILRNLLPKKLDIPTVHAGQCRIAPHDVFCIGAFM